MSVMDKRYGLRRSAILATWYLSALAGVRRRGILVALGRAFRRWSLIVVPAIVDGKALVFSLEPDLDAALDKARLIQGEQRAATEIARTLEAVIARMRHTAIHETRSQTRQLLTMDSVRTTTPHSRISPSRETLDDLPTTTPHSRISPSRETLDDLPTTTPHSRISTCREILDDLPTTTPHSRISFCRETLDDLPTTTPHSDDLTTTTPHSQISASSREDEDTPRSLATSDARAHAARAARLVYKLGEELYGAVDADFREARGVRPPVHISHKVLEVFRKRFETARNRLARSLDKCAAAVREASEEEDLLRELLDVVLAATRAEWHARRRQRREAPTVLKSPRWRTDHLHDHRPCKRTGCDLCSARAAADLEAQTALGVVSDPGPRDYWDLLAQTAKTVADVLASRATDLATLELHAWHIALLVRTHKRDRGLRLRRIESQRKMLDLRLYEILLLHLICTRFPDRLGIARQPAIQDDDDDDDDE